MSWDYSVTTSNDWKYEATTSNDWYYIVAEGDAAVGTTGGKPIVTKASRKYIVTKDGRYIKTKG